MYTGAVYVRDMGLTVWFPTTDETPGLDGGKAHEAADEGVAEHAHNSEQALLLLVHDDSLDGCERTTGRR